MSTQFIKKKAYFLNKNQVLPNAMAFDIRLSSDAFRLLTCFNALPDNWVIYQSDIQERLAWSERRMRNAIKICCRFGYMRKYQLKEEKTQRFSHNAFEWDTTPSFPENNDNECPHNECEPSDTFPSTAPPHAESARQSCSSYEDKLYREQTNRDPNEDDPPNEEISHVDVVCSLLNEEEKLKLLSKYNLEDSFIKIIIKHDYDRIKLAAMAYDQWKQKKNDSSDPIDNEGSG